MPPGDVMPGSPEDWLRHAKADLALARAPLPEGSLYKYLAFHAQQAVEKSLKAILLSRGVEFPRIHSIERLIDLIPPDVERPADLIQSASLSAFATAFRYPEASEIDADDYQEALRLAESIVTWAEAKVQAGST
jgi:HEPN domain-containing protein